jgi:hypothetical protein
MPLYYFVLTTHEATHEPGEPVEFAGLDAAWEEATTAAGEIIKDCDGSLPADAKWQIQIQDESRKPLRTIRLLTETNE